MEAHKGDGQDGPKARGTKSEGATRWTTDHAFIRRWVEARGGHPSWEHGRDGHEGSGILRIDYSGFRDDGRLETISWDEFFRTFDEANLAFVYQEKAEVGEEDRLSKLVDRSLFAGETPPVNGRSLGPIGEA